MVILEDDNDYEDIYRLLKITTGEIVIGNDELGLVMADLLQFVEYSLWICIK